VRDQKAFIQVKITRSVLCQSPSLVKVQLLLVVVKHAAAAAAVQETINEKPQKNLQVEVLVAIHRLKT
jgi:hypothetical protein